MNYMVCVTCHYTVQSNSIGICLGCQMGASCLQEDAWKPAPKKVEKEAALPKSRKKI